MFFIFNAAMIEWLGHRDVVGFEVESVLAKKMAREIFVETNVNNSNKIQLIA